MEGHLGGSRLTPGVSEPPPDEPGGPAPPAPREVVSVSSLRGEVAMTPARAPDVALAAGEGGGEKSASEASLHGHAARAQDPLFLLVLRAAHQVARALGATIRRQVLAGGLVWPVDIRPWAREASGPRLSLRGWAPPLLPGATMGLPTTSSGRRTAVTSAASPAPPRPRGGHKRRPHPLSPI